MSTPRIERLREKSLIPPEVCFEKPYWYTESMKRTVGQDHHIRRAKALANVLENMKIGIDPDELLAGRTTGKVRGGLLNIESNGINWMLNELDTIHCREWDRYAPLTEEDKAMAKELAAYWADKSLLSRYNAMLSEDAIYREYIVHGVGAFCDAGYHMGHLIVCFDKILEIGISGLIKEIDEKLAQLNDADADNDLRINNYQSWKIALQSIITFANRHADLAEQMANESEDPAFKAEKLEMARICRKVPEFPADTFAEAMQSVWFTYCGVMIDQASNGVSFGRLDQYLYPYYKKDLEEGIMTRDEMVELLASFNIKCNGVTLPLSDFVSAGFGGHCLACDFTIGGIDVKGNDAVNDLTYAILDAQLESRTRADDLVIRVHYNNPNKFVRKALDVSIQLSGKIKWVGDEATIETLMADGKSIYDARNYATEGCFQPSVTGKSLDIPGGPMNTTLFIDLVMNRGFSPMTNKQIGPDTGDPREFTCYEDFWNAYKKQVDALYKYSLIYNYLDTKVRVQECNNPLVSPFFEGCMEKGLDVVEGGTAPYWTHTILLAGTPNTGNCLAAIKKCVFEDKTLTMDEVLKACAVDFEGYPDVLKVVEKAPKFGNGDPYVDTLVNDVISYCSDKISSHPGINGCKWTCAGACVTNNVPMGKVVGATPDGRRKAAPLAEGGISPYQGTNVSGLTPTFVSVASLDHSKMTGGTVLNCKMSPGMVKDEVGKQRFASLIRTYFQMGGMLVQFNIVDTNLLKEAQKHPEQYKDLLVRVSTYSAYFVELSDQLQNDVINRSEIDQF